MNPPSKRKVSNVSRISLVAKSAWQKLHKSGVIEEDFDTWRREECLRKFGVRLSAAPKSMHDEIEAHFMAMGGATGKAFEKLTGPENSERRMRHVIAKLSKELGMADPQSYAQSLGARQLTGVIINLRRSLRNAANPPPEGGTTNTDN